MDHVMYLLCCLAAAVQLAKLVEFKNVNILERFARALLLYDTKWRPVSRVKGPGHKLQVTSDDAIDDALDAAKRFQRLVRSGASDTSAVVEVLRETGRIPFADAFRPDESLEEHVVVFKSHCAECATKMADFIRTKQEGAAKAVGEAVRVRAADVSCESLLMLIGAFRDKGCGACDVVLCPSAVPGKVVLSPVVFSDYAEDIFHKLLLSGADMRKSKELLIGEVIVAFWDASNVVVLDAKTRRKVVQIPAKATLVKVDSGGNCVGSDGRAAAKACLVPKGYALLLKGKHPTAVVTGIPMAVQSASASARRASNARRTYLSPHKIGSIKIEKRRKYWVEHPLSASILSALMPGIDIVCNEKGFQ